MAGRKRQSIDYSAIKQRFLTSPTKLTASKLAKEFGCGESTVRAKMAEEHWIRLRKEMLAQASYVATIEAVKDRAEQFLLSDIRQIDIASQIEDELEDLLRVCRTLRGNPTLAGVMDTIASTLLKVQKAKRIAQGRETERTTQDHTGTITVVDAPKIKGIRERLLHKLGINGGQPVSLNGEPEA